MEEVAPGRVWTWTVRGLYVGLIAANLWLAWDWWAQSESGQAAIERWSRRLEEVKVKVQECEGCAQRKAKLTAAMNRMHWQAEKIVEEAAADTEPEP
jgi:hypothetical protein